MMLYLDERVLLLADLVEVETVWIWTGLFFEEVSAVFCGPVTCSDQSIIQTILINSLGEIIT